MCGQLLSLAPFFTIEARDYTNFAFDAATRASVRNIILALCAGIILAAAYTLYQSMVPGAFVRALLRAQAHSEEDAKTPAELGFEKSLTLDRQLRKNAMLQRVLRRVDSPDGAPMRYFIPEGEKYRAEARAQRRGNGPVGFAITVVLSVAIALLLIRLLPLILTAVDRLLG